MELFIDSADLEVLKRLWDIKIFAGITTNPIILARSQMDPAGLASGLAGWFMGNVFIQASGGDTVSLVESARKMHELLPGQVIVKIPSTVDGIKAIGEIELSGIPTAATALFTTGQAVSVTKAGVSFIIPFYDRLEKAGGDVPQLLKDLVQLQNISAKPRILVASVKTKRQFEECFRAGVWAVTLPAAQAESLMHSPLTEDAVKKFNEAASHTEE